MMGKKIFTVFTEKSCLSKPVVCTVCMQVKINLLFNRKIPSSKIFRGILAVKVLIKISPEFKTLHLIVFPCPLLFDQVCMVKANYYQNTIYIATTRDF